MAIWREWVSGTRGGNGHDLFKEEQRNQSREPGVAAGSCKAVDYGEGFGFDSE